MAIDILTLGELAPEPEQSQQTQERQKRTPEKEGLPPPNSTTQNEPNKRLRSIFPGLHPHHSSSSRYLLSPVSSISLPAPINSLSKFLLPPSNFFSGRLTFRPKMAKVVMVNLKDKGENEATVGINGFVICIFIAFVLFQICVPPPRRRMMALQRIW